MVVCPVIAPDAFTGLSVCSGAGALDLALDMACPDMVPVCYLEREAYAAATLVQAMEAGALASAPLWSDARTFRGRCFRGCVDLIYGGIPCQPHSTAGKRGGRADSRDLWPAFRRIAVQCAARFIFIENVEGLLSSGGGERIHRDLRRLGFQVAGGLFTAAEVGAPHGRERLFILAAREPMADADGRGRGRRAQNPVWPAQQRAVDPWASLAALFPPEADDADAWRATLAVRPSLEPLIPGISDGMADRLDLFAVWAAHARASRVDRMRLIGNGVVPLAAAFAFRTLAIELAGTCPSAVELVQMMGAA